MNEGLRRQIFAISSEKEFKKTALEIFKHQVNSNEVYANYVSALHINPGSIRQTGEIPFLPVSFFKGHKIICRGENYDAVFESSGTSGQQTSKHYVADLKLYEDSYKFGFRHFFGEPAEYFFVSLLPSYSERENSSLVFMMNGLSRESKYPGSGFFNNDPESLIRILRECTGKGIKTILVGVSFALLNLAEKYKPDLSGTIIVETGGMKGRRTEITREELHSILKSHFNVGAIHSEYGMTELLSQAWSRGNGIYYSPPWMKIFIRDSQDPLTLLDDFGKTGGINIIDLANINSCSFLMVNDLGKLHKDGGFEVLGRFDNSDIRGCNLMVE